MTADRRLDLRNVTCKLSSPFYFIFNSLRAPVFFVRFFFGRLCAPGSFSRPDQSTLDLAWFLRICEPRSAELNISHHAHKICRECCRHGSYKTRLDSRIFALSSLFGKKLISLVVASSHSCRRSLLDAKYYRYFTAHIKHIRLIRQKLLLREFIVAFFQ